VNYVPNMVNLFLTAKEEGGCFVATLLAMTKVIGLKGDCFGTPCLAIINEGRDINFTFVIIDNYTNN